MKRLLLILALLAAGRAPGQSVPQGLLTAATTTTSGGRQWLYVRWTGTDGSLPFGTPFAVWLKNGAAAATVPLTEQGVSLPAVEAAIASTHLSRAASLGTDMAALTTDVTAIYDSVRAAHAAGPDAASLPADNAPLPQKLARLIQQAASGDPRTAQALRQAALVHPGVALAIGDAWAGPVTAAAGAPVTVELRSWDAVTCRETGIAGRITVNAGQPVVLTAPGASVQVPDNTSTGDRVIKLRWATPDALRRESPLMAGHQIWRVTSAAAEIRGWHVTAPSAAALKALAASSPLLAKQVNFAPVWPGKLFTAGSVADFNVLPPGDPLTHYFVDDNDRYTANAVGDITGTAFADGAAFYYFTAARDLLGREGNVSPAGLGIACARSAPPVPSELTLTDETLTTGLVPAQSFLLRWKANAPEGDNDTDAYLVYRGSQATTPGVDLADPATLPPPVATVEHAPDADGWITWRDATLPQNTDGTTTYWYAVRAVHRSPVAPDNVSRPTPPVYGGLRAGAAPGNTVVTQSISCPLAGLLMASATAPFTFEPLPAEEAKSELRTVKLRITRTDRGVAWIGIRWNWSGHSEAEFTRYEFDDDEDEVDPEFVLPVTAAATLSMIAGAHTGSESRIVQRVLQPQNIGDWDAGEVLVLTGRAAAPGLSELRIEDADHLAMFGLSPPAALAVSDLGGGCAMATLNAPDHTPFVIAAQRGGVWTTVTGAEVMQGTIFFCDPAGIAPAYRSYLVQTGSSVCMHMADGADGRIRPVRLRLRLPANSAEYRIYRRVDEGALQLIAQGDGSTLPGLASVAREVLREDSALPANAARLCYYGQVFNRAGMAGPLQPLGDCIMLARRQVETPVLNLPRSGGTAAAPTMRLEWYCPPQGVERFQIRLDPESAGTPAPVSPQLKAASTRPVIRPVRRGGARRWLHSTLTMKTGVVGRDFGAGPVFTMEFPVRSGTAWRVSITAVSTAGVTSAASAVQPFLWNLPPPPPQPAPEPVVDWPARPLPPAGTWHPLVRAELTRRNMSNDFHPWERWSLRSPGTSSDYPVGVRIASLRVRAGTDPTLFVAERPAGSGRFTSAVNFGDYTGITGSYDSAPTQFLLSRGSLPGSENALASSIALQLEQQTSPSAIAPRLMSGAGQLLPAVLYRRQVPSPRFPAASGATIQVSPLLRDIAWGYHEEDFTEIRDPYIGVVSRTGRAAPDSGGSWLDLFLLDTQPVVKGARYHYTLLRFDAANGEIIESVNAGEVLIPDTL